MWKTITLQKAAAASTSRSFHFGRTWLHLPSEKVQGGNPLADYPTPRHLFLRAQEPTSSYIMFLRPVAIFRVSELEIHRKAEAIP
jgi:hypothetical protein